MTQKERIAEAFAELLDMLDEVTGAEPEKKAPPTIRVFTCPFFEECPPRCKEGTVKRCKAPFLRRKDTGGIVCGLTIEREKIKIWSDAVNNYETVGKTPTGEWVEKMDNHKIFSWKECSNCGKEAEILQAGGGCELLSDFCPHYGADMRKVER